MVDLLRKSSFLLFNKLHFCTMTPMESTPNGVLFSLAPPPVPERSTLRAEGAEGGRISFEILPTRAVRLEVCRLLQCPFFIQGLRLDDIPFLAEWMISKAFRFDDIHAFGVIGRKPKPRPLPLSLRDIPLAAPDGNRKEGFWFLLKRVLNF